MRVLSISVVMVMLAAGAVFAASEQATMPVNLPPQVIEVKGTTAAHLGPSVFPQFIEQNATDNPNCEDWLAKDVSAGGLSGAPVTTISPYGNKTMYPAYLFDGRRGAWQPVPELKIANFVIPDEYRKSARLLVNWTVRVEGRAIPVCPASFNRDTNTDAAGNACVHYWPQLCHPWHGTASVAYQKGNVMTKVYVNGQPLGKPFILEVPGPGQVSGNQPYDPTLTGSFLIAPEDLGMDEFPSTIRSIEIWWANETAMQITSPANATTTMRNMSVTFMPLGESVSE